MKYITLLGMSRSGNHAIVRWLTSHWEEAGYAVFFQNNVSWTFLQHLEFLMGERDRESKKVLLVSLEDLNAVVDERMGSLTRMADHNILLMRDPLNLFASRIEGLGPDRGLFFRDGADERERTLAATEVMRSLPRQMDNYINHWREFSRQTSLLSNKVCVSYNDWVMHGEYRRRIVEGLGLSFSDSGYMTRVDSSFDGHVQAPDDYLNRWRALWDRRVFSPVRDNPDMIRIAGEFGVVVQ